MSNVVFINLDGHGHINPTLAIASQLVERGHRVNYVVTEAFAQMAAATGATVKVYDSLWRQREPPNAANMSAMMAQLPLRLLAEAEHTVPQLYAWLEAEGPDVVLYDSMSIAARLLVASLRLPAIMMNASYASNERFNLGQSFAGEAPSPKLLDEIKAVKQRLATAYRVDEAILSDLFNHAEPLNLVFLPRAFQLEGGSFDERFVFCGPQLAPRPVTQTWHRPARETGSERRQRPLLFISLGTVFSNWPEFFNMCFEAFANEDVDVVMSISARVDQARLHPAPANFTVAPFFPQLEVLAAADVFVSHGGMNSTMEALYFGVPLAVVPQMPEQAVTAKRVAALGLGRAFTRDEVSVATLRREILPLAKDAAVAAAVAKMQAEVRAAGGIATAVAAVEGFLARGRWAAGHGAVAGHGAAAAKASAAAVAAAEVGASLEASLGQHT